MTRDLLEIADTLRDANRRMRQDVIRQRVYLVALGVLAGRAFDVRGAVVAGGVILGTASVAANVLADRWMRRHDLERVPGR